MNHAYLYTMCSLCVYPQCVSNNGIWVPIILWPLEAMVVCAIEFA